MRIALCYDRINKFGGAERVLTALHELWPDAPIYTLTYSPGTAQWADGWTIRTSFLQKVPILGRFHELFPPLAPLAWEHFNLTEYDVVVSVTSAEAKSILIRPGAVHISYCLTPTRYYWSGYNNYLANPGMGILNGLVRFVFPYFSYILRVYDFYHAQRPEVLVGISRAVQARILKYYRRDTHYIYPPVITEPRKHLIKSIHKKHFLVVSRLVPYKRIDIVIEAFNRLGWPLHIVGTGSQESILKRSSRPNITFRGFISDEELGAEYESAIAVIFPTDEDFGIVPIEAQAHGIPVVAYRKGGALETVREGITGAFFDAQTCDSLYSLLFSSSNSGDFTSAISYFSRFSPESCIDNASRFSTDSFQRQFLALVKESAPISSL